MGNPRITLNATPVAAVLAAVAGALVLASVAGQLTKYLTGHDHVFGLIALFNLDGENNLPAFYAVFLLLVASALLLATAWLERARGGADARYWAVLGAGFLLMSVDEACSLHEALIPPMRQLLGAGRLGIFYYAWVVPALVFVALAGVYFLQFVRRLPPATRHACLLAAALYLGGALGVELLEGRHRELHGGDPMYNVYVTVEEALEYAGLVVLIHGLLRHLAAHHGELRVGFANVAATPRRESVLRRRLRSRLRGATTHAPTVARDPQVPASGLGAASAAPPAIRTSD
jgi:hypothetical protein